MTPASVFVITFRLPFAARGFRTCLFLLLLGTVPAVSWGDTSPAERAALIDLYDSTGGPGWSNKAGWNGPPGTECTWYGVLCDGGGSVLELNLAVNNLVGPLPASLGQLTQLTSLLLLGNQLSGSIPSEIGNLESLVVLALELNHLSGEIPPSLGTLAHLEWLSAGANQLSGSLPAQLGNLANLQVLSLGGNHLSGSIPPALGGLAQLVRLNLAKNELTGSIPTVLGGLANLRVLLLGENHLSGALPVTFGNLINLENFVVSSNQLTGGIPATLGNLIQVQDMDLSFNHFSGSIPSTLGGLAQVRVLQLGSNQLSGEIPGELQNLTQLIDRDPSGFGGLNLHYNALHTDDPGLEAFLDAKHLEPQWQSTQTVAPTDLTAGAATETSLTLSWTPIAYAADAGGYVVRYSTTAGGPFAVLPRTPSKSDSSVVVTGLAPATTYHFVVSTVTDLHDGNPNAVSSEGSAEVAGTTEERGKIAVRIDIKPGSEPNRIHLSSPGKLPVAVFSDAGFDATQVDPTTVTLAQAPVAVKPNGRLLASFEDVDGDGRLDLLVQFHISLLDLTPANSKAVLKGRTTAGVRLRGVDSVRVVP